MREDTVARSISSEALTLDVAKAAAFKSGRLARLLNISPRHLRRLFRQDLNCAPQEWLDTERLRLIRRRLLAGRPLKEICEEVAFSDCSHLCHWFGRVSGTTTSRFKAQAEGRKLARPEHEPLLRLEPPRAAGSIRFGRV